jgi:hypothetical protein
MVERSGTLEGQLPPYSVLRVHLDEARAADGHRHVDYVETVDPDGGETRWTSVEVIAAIRDGERFVLDEGEGHERLEPTLCPRCPMATLEATDTDVV